MKKCWITELYYNELIEQDLKEIEKNKQIMKLFIKKKANIKLPIKATDKAAGFDVFCTKITTVGNNKYICHTDLHMQPSKGHKIILVPRSSLTNTNWILGNHIGIGDEDYRGEYQFRFTGIPTGINVMNLFRGENMFTYDPFPFKVGDRIGQIFLSKVIPTEIEIVTELKNNPVNIEKPRNGGFGSTGT